MALRKEQVLALSSLALGALVLTRCKDDDWRAPTVAATTKAYDATSPKAAPLLTTPPIAMSQRLWFREPSETQPLPPRPLPFPAQLPLSLVALPLDPGPDLARADLLLIDGSVTEGITLESAAATEGAPPAEPELAPASVVETRAQKKERYRRQYDQVW
ncbi:MAG: hypothetical protein ABL997_18230, partial [Planctomycetota bacterium]